MIKAPSSMRVSLLIGSGSSSIEKTCGIDCLRAGRRRARRPARGDARFGQPLFCSAFFRFEKAISIGSGSVLCEGIPRSAASLRRGSGGSGIFMAGWVVRSAKQPSDRGAMKSRPMFRLQRRHQLVNRQIGPRVDPSFHKVRDSGQIASTRLSLSISLTHLIASPARWAVSAGVFPCATCAVS